MKSVAFALLLVAGCTPDVDQYPVVPSSNPPALAQAHENPNEAPDAGTGGGVGDGGVGDGGVFSDGGTPGFDALPTAFDAGAPTDVGSPAADAL